jgi:hypothetical protein
MRDLRVIIEEWLGAKRLNSPLHADLQHFFEEALPNTMLPEESGFGYPPKKHSLGVFYKNLMLAGVFGRTMEIIVDEDIGDRIGYRTRPVSTSVPHGPTLYWITSDITNIGSIARIPDVWKYYQRATLLAGANPSIRGHGRDYTTDKVRLSLLLKGEGPSVDSTALEKTIGASVQRSATESRRERLKRLALAPAKPAIIVTRSRSFLRNPDVIVEVLLRARGQCEQCGEPAPFRRDIDGSPYLEVHHLIPLAENGDDTVANAKALCPNCHRHAHFGRASFLG